MELRHLRYFIAAAEEENVSRAALKLRVSQPGISRQIKDLEDEIGFQLFERSAKSLKLTEAGKFFLTEAKSILQRADDAVKNARAVAGGTNGEINVGYARFRRNFRACVSPCTICPRKKCCRRSAKRNCRWRSLSVRRPNCCAG